MRLLIVSNLLIVITITGSLWCEASEQNNARLLEFLKSIDACVIGSIYSFLYPSSYLPRTASEMQATCKSQVESFKCVREKVKTGPALIKRGMASLVANRQRHQRKYCANLNSELTKKFIEHSKCLRDKKFEVYKKIDSDFANYLVGIRSLKGNNTAQELNHLCCATSAWRKNMIASIGPECASSKEYMEELAYSIVSSEIGLICDDDEKLATKICPKLQPLNQGKPFDTTTGNSPSTSALYVVATFGESRD